jgi:hypothetical protein
MDWSGVFLLNSGLLLLLVGISIGGEHPWSSAIVLSPLVIGIVELLAFWIWEWKGSTNPFMARELFAKQQRKFVMFLIVDFVAGMGLYAAAAFWAQLVRGMMSSFFVGPDYYFKVVKSQNADASDQVFGRAIQLRSVCSHFQGD